MAELYETLPPNSFRVLEFIGSHKRSRLAFRLHTLQMHDEGLQNDSLHHDHRNPTSYTAISHAWNKSDKEENVFINDQQILVGVDSWKCLFRISKNRRLLWIDTLCINQEDLEERAQQVSIMGNIYRNAQDVAAWLGTDDQDLDIKGIKSRPGVLFSLKNLNLCCDRPYWRHTWIVQEVCLAKPLILYINEYRINEEQFCTALALHTGILFMTLKGRADPTPIVRLDPEGIISKPKQYDKWRPLTVMMSRHMLTSVECNPKTDLHSLLAVNNESLCTDLRDKVFAFLGLISAEECQQLLTEQGLPSYNLSVAQVMIEVLSHLALRLRGSHLAGPIIKSLNLVELEAAGDIRLHHIHIRSGAAGYVITAKDEESVVDLHPKMAHFIERYGGVNKEDRKIPRPKIM